MSEIVKYIPNAMSIEDSQIIKAAKGTAIKAAISLNGDVSSEAKNKIEAAITRALVNLNQKKVFEKETDFKVFITSLVSMLVEKHPFITLDEFSKAVLYGSIGEFKKEQEMLYLSVANINLWIKAYLEQKKLPLMAKISKQKQEEEHPKMSEGQIRQIMIDGLKRKFNHFKNTGEFDDPGNASYNFLDELGLIPFAIDVKKEIFETAKRNIKNQKEVEKFNGGGLDVHRFIKALEAGDKKEEIKVEAKKLALRMLFENWIELEIEINELFNSTNQVQRGE
jgi:hypothetical protein